MKRRDIGLVLRESRPKDLEGGEELTSKGDGHVLN